MNTPRTRRDFILQAGIATMAATLGRRPLRAAVTSAADKVNVALIGCGHRGAYVARGMLEEGANITHLCDLHPERREQVRTFLSEWGLGTVSMESDLRRVLESREVDAVIVATPDHWHAPASILACQAGKDVYVEKPHAHNIWESTKLIEAADKYGRVVQVGTQCRSGPYILDALEYIRSGALGKISLVKVFNMKPGHAFRLGDPGDIPPDFDWNSWLGRAPARPYHQRIFNHGWHHFWDFSGGDMADDGIHQLDIALMLMGDPGLPGSVRSIGGRYAHRGDDSEVPDVQVVNWDFDDFVMTFELTGYPKYMRKTDHSIRRNDELPYWSQNATRVEIYGSDLMMTVGRHGGGWIAQREGGKVVEKHFGRPPDQAHIRNFLDCVRSRRRPSADIRIAHRSNLVMHMGNLAHRVGNTALAYDAGTGTFDRPEANALIKPEYRKGFEIPDRV